MKRLMTLLLAAGLVLGTTSAAKAVDFKMTGLWQNRVSFADRNFEKHNGDDKMRAATRLRTQIDVIASESLKGVMFFEIGHQNWGKAAEGAALGTDGKEIKVRYSYVDWIIPQTDAKVRMGLQPYVQPTFTGIGSPILDADGAGITISNQFTENVGTNLFWLRAANDNDPEMTKHDAHDALDFIGLTVPLTFDGVKVTPWAMYGFVGRDSFENAGASGDQKKLLQGLLPLGVSNKPLTGNSLTDRHGDAWWAGFTTELKVLDPFRFALDATYGRVDLGEGLSTKGKKIDVKREGWIVSALAEYKMESVTPGLTAWYSSGDDANVNNGSERLPQYNTPWAVSALGFGGGWTDIATWKVLGHNPGGLWGVVLHLKDISLMEDLKHTLRAGYYHGTNNSAMPKAANMASYPSRIDGPFAYLTTSDDAWELNADTRYKIYENLELAVEAAYVRLNLDEGTWGKKIVNEVDKDSYRVSIGLKYSF